MTSRSPRLAMYGHDVIAALVLCCTVLGMPAGNRLASMLGELAGVCDEQKELAQPEVHKHARLREATATRARTLP